MSKLSNFILNAEKCGLPVGFMRVVNTGYTIDEGSDSDSNTANTRTNTLSIRKSDLAMVGNNLSFAPPHDKARALQPIYHEATHAWFDLKEDDGDVKTIVREGERYYENSPLEDKTVGDDPDRIFQEAAASYVGHRIAAWWVTVDLMLSYVADADADLKRGATHRARVVTKLKELRRDYGTEMAKRVFGYQEVGWPAFKKQRETTRSIYPSLKDYCDRVLLESKIPDQFDQCPKATETWKVVLQTFPEVAR